jgi:hypothetical protein
LVAGEYSVTSQGDLDTNFNSDYASKGYEYFDVWAPEIATSYGQAFWTDQGSQPLPPDVVKRFDGKVIAIQGYEQDQVMVQPAGQPGANPSKDVSVPINWGECPSKLAETASATAQLPRAAERDAPCHRECRPCL